MTPDIVMVHSDTSPGRHILVASCGYEERSVYFTTALDLMRYDKILIGDYGATGYWSYDKNRRMLDDLKDASISPSQSIGSAVHDALAREKCSITIDISSFDRSAISSILIAIFRNWRNVKYVNILYYPQIYVEPDYRLETVKSFGPVSPYLSGSTTSPNRRLCLVFGAGHEFGKAIGAVDTLEPDDVFCFRPHGIDKRYDQSIAKSNLNFDFIENTQNIIDYNLEDPFETYMKLRSLLDTKRRTDSVIVLPLGPKLFAALCIIVALVYHPEIKVWRHSTVSLQDLSLSKQAVAAQTQISFAFSFVER